MVKTINIILEDSEHKELSTQKEQKTWKQCLMLGVKQ
jgi:hypothetical protein